MLNFITADDIMRYIDEDIIKRRIQTTPRNGNSIALRPIIYNCIREVYYEIFDYPRVMPDNLDSERSFYWTAPLGSAIHERLQEITGLDQMEWTEELIEFNTFSPLTIRSKCDGIDTRDPENCVLYEIKTKNSIPSKPYKEELLQNLLSCLLFKKEKHVPIKGSAMIYTLRENPNNVAIFCYDFFDKASPYYFDINAALKPVISKIQEIIYAMINRTVPSMSSPYVITRAFGRSKCETCVYRAQCMQDG